MGKPAGNYKPQADGKGWEGVTKRHKKCKGRGMLKRCVVLHGGSRQCMRGVIIKRVCEVHGRVREVQIGAK